jgi:predicted transcriptional regulator
MATQLRHQWLKDMLMDKGISQRRVADMLEVTEGAVSKFLRSGEGINMTYPRVMKLASALEIKGDEVNLRLEEKSYAPAHAPVMTPDLQVDGMQSLDKSLDKQATDALDNLTKAVEAARKAFAPIGYTVRCIIEREL